MNLAVFDLDHTLLAGDSDHLWGEFLVELGAVDGAWYRAENERFYGEYRAGTLDMAAYLAFALKPLADHPMARLLAWRERFMAEKIAPIVAAGAPALLERHRAQGDTLLITSATNRFVTEPIAALLGVPHLLSTDPELRDGRYTGRVSGTPNFREGKVTRLRAWLQAQPAVRHISASSDSHNDLPLLGMAQSAVAVDPDDILRAEANRRGWPVISLREPPAALA
jgi:HAD superfamily hydrolase (TIGR01490 family)